LGHLKHHMIWKKGSGSLDRQIKGQDQVGPVLIRSVKIKPGRTSATNKEAEQAGSLELRGFFQFNDRQMPAARQVRHSQRDPLAATPTHWGGRSGTRRASGPLSPWLEPWRSRSRQALKVDFIWSRRLQTAVRPMAVVPLDEEADLTAECSPIQRHENATQSLPLHGSHQSFDHRDAAVLLDGPEALADATPPAPSPESLVGELRPLVGDEVVRGSARIPDGPAEHLADGDTGWILGEYRDTHDAPREMIDDDANPPAKRPALGHRPREPGHPETGGGWDGREINIPDLVEASGSDRPVGRASTHCAGPGLMRQHSGYGRRAEVQPGASQEVGDANLAHGGAEDLQAAYHVADEVWKSVHRLAHLDQCSWAFLIYTPHP